jgi:ribosome-associated toxin RatA of RatAB toxin-antitoxin module
MKQIQVHSRLPRNNADEAFALLCDFSAYPEYCDSVRSVQVQTVNEETLSSWEVDFQSGILKWQERDTFDRVNREIRFEQVAGDIDHFSGTWSVHAHEQGSELFFRAQFDLGIPMLSDMLDPIAQKAIEENIQSIIRGLFFSQRVQVN